MGASLRKVVQARVGARAVNGQAQGKRIKNNGVPLREAQFGEGRLECRLQAVGLEFRH